MSEIMPVRLSFPPTAGKRHLAQHIERSVQKRREVARARRFAQYLVECICVQSSVTSVAIYSRRQDRRVSVPRNFAYWIMRYHPSAQFSFPVIGEIFNRDHTTAMNAIKNLHQRIVDGPGDADEQIYAQRICNMLALHGFKDFDVRGAR